MSNYLFTDHYREHRPLGGLLDQWAGPARSWARSLGRADFAARSDEELVAQVLSDWNRQAIPLSRQATPKSYQEPRQIQRRQDDGVHVGHWRWLFKFPVNGNLELLQSWPTKLDVQPCGTDLYDMPTPKMVWEVTAEGPLAIFDVPVIDDVAGLIPPDERVLAAARLLDQVIQLTNQELTQYKYELTQELHEIIAARRTRLSSIERRTQETIALVARECPPLQVVEVSSPPVKPVDEKEGPATIELPLAATRKTFADLVHVTQRWIDSSQFYPAVFAKLKEEEITSILVAALNLAFDTAQREVFIGDGKCDMYIEAGLGNRTRAVFVGESKIWSGPAGVDGHLRQLLERYTPSHIREVMFLYYVKENDFDAIQEKSAPAIRATTMFIRWIEEGSRAVMAHPTFGHDVEVAILYAHFPRRVRPTRS